MAPKSRASVPTQASTRIKTRVPSSSDTILLERNGLIKGLPQEILDIILMGHVKQIAGHGDELIIRFIYGENKIAVNLAALRVCRLWRATLISKPYLWTNIRAYIRIELTGKKTLSTITQTLFTRLRRRLAWANGHPIDLILDCTFTNYGKKLERLYRNEMNSILKETSPLIRSLCDESECQPILLKYITTPENSHSLTRLTLKDPTISFRENPTEVAYGTTPFSLPNLDWLYLRFNGSNIDIVRVLTLFESPKLKFLTMLSRNRVSILELVATFPRFPILEELYLCLEHSEPAMVVTSFESIGTSIRRFEYAKALGSYGVDEDGLSSFRVLGAYMPNVEDLTLARVYTLSELNQSQFLRGLKTLRIFKSIDKHEHAHWTGRKMEELKRTLKFMVNLQTFSLGIGESKPSG